MENKPEKIVYTAVAQSTGGRSGRSVSTDPDLSLDLRAPKAMGGPGDGTNPEQLFAMGYGACFQGALGLAAKEAGVSVKDSVVRTSVGIGPEGESFAISVLLEVFIPGVPLEQAEELARRTHQLCPYSKATRGNVPVEVVAIESL
ncbi:MAG: organic hydroperoxide resistance protein [Actinomyces sp.]|nr:organic hydroperoxide resistance protein [Actinomyces sp.]MDN6428724.1 organic hydroperoxide resistance protein [Propionibacterium sp.]MDN6566003.1 organic hydroperoxide resistance protein [Actinomyces sp.]MDN6793862.1 organic hydroperoxide resistance protein [Propionibacterium sp.]